MSTFDPVHPMYERGIAERAAEVKFNETRAEKRDKNIKRDKNYNLDELYDFAHEFGRVWSDIFLELTTLPALPDVSLINKIFLASDRKLFVGVFLVLISTLYLFVFMSSS